MLEIAKMTVTSRIHTSVPDDGDHLVKHKRDFAEHHQLPRQHHTQRQVRIHRRLGIRGVRLGGQFAVDGDGGGCIVLGGQ